MGHGSCKRGSARPRVGHRPGRRAACWAALGWPGALDALAERDRDRGRRAPRSSSGPPPGSAIGALATAGVAPGELAAYACGRSLEGLRGWLGRRHAAPRRRRRAARRRDGLPAGAGAPRCPRPARGGWRSPRSRAPGAATPRPPLLAGWMPKGVIDTRPLRDGIDRVGGPGWPSAPALWIAACDYRTGRRVTLRPPPAARRRRCRRRSPPPARCPASTARCGSAGAATSTAASARCPTWTCSAAAARISSSASTRRPRARPSPIARPGAAWARGAARRFRAPAGP